MRRLLLFIALAGAGLAALVGAAGSFFGRGGDEPSPEVPVVARDAAPTAQTGDAPLPLSAFPGNFDERTPDVALLDPMKLDFPLMADREWKDPVTGERVALPYFVEMSLRVRDLEPFRDPSTGAAGNRWKDVHVTVYRDPSTLTRAEAERLAADPAERRNLVLYEVQAAEGHANFPLGPAESGRSQPTVRMQIYLRKDVEIHVVREDVRILTSDVTLDREAGTAEGPSDITATSASFLVRGRGFRLDRAARRIEILERPEIDLRGLATSNGSPAPFDLGSGAFRPKVVRARGSAVVVQRDGDDGVPLYDAVLRDGVHAEAEDGSHLDSDVLELRAVRDGARRGSDGVPGSGDQRYRLVRVVADGNVSGESGTRTDVSGRSVPTFAVTTARLTSGFEDGSISRAVLEGRTSVRWVGELSMPGGRKAVGTLFATCRERLSYGPRAIDAADAPPCDAVLDLVGSARVESDAAAPGGEPERLEADRLQLFLRRNVGPPPEASAQASLPPGADQMRAVAFAATGGNVRISGPRVNGTAHEMKGFDLDGDAWRIVAAGPDTRLEVAEGIGRRREATEPGETAEPGTPPAERPEWTLDRLSATDAVRGVISPRPGDPAVTFSADTLDYSAATGGELRAADGRRAVLVYPGPDGRDDTIEAPLVGFRLDETERRLWTRFGSKAVVWGGPRPTTRSAAPEGARRIALRSGSRIEFLGGMTSGGESTISVRALDGAAIESRLGTTEADRVAAREITVTLVQRVTRSGGSLLAGATGKDRKPRDPAAPSAAAAPAASAAPSRWTLDCRDLDVVMGDAPGAAQDLAGLRSIEARGAVDARTQPVGSGDEAQRFEGELLTFAGATGTGRLEGTPETRARVTLGSGDLAQRLASPTMEFAVVDGRISTATLAAPVTGLFHVAERGRTAVERYVVKSDAGPLVVTGDGALVHGTPAVPVVVERSLREGETANFEKSMTLASPTVRMVTDGADLGRGARTIRSFDAEGPQTRIEVHKRDGGSSRAMGDRIAYDATTSTLRLTGVQGVQVLDTDAKGRTQQGRVNWLTYNTKTGEVDAEGGDVVLELGK
ncbi:MAG TPA: hypothetical protein VND21_04690 [Planctomycetota bacterium]|nr:hypothetical protein [Planctomycetota bacterium]